MKKPNILLLFTFILLGFIPAIGQDVVRLSADFTIKQKQGDKGQLVKGKVYYDKNYQKLFYKIDFPEPEFWLIKDTTFYQFSSDTVLKKVTHFPYNASFAIYTTILNNDFNDLGLSKLGFKINEITETDDGVITEYLPSERLGKSLGKVLLHHEEKQLKAAVFFDIDNNLLSKEQYKDLQVIDDILVPGQVTALTYNKEEEVEMIKITLLQNVQFNDTQNERLYNFPVPDAACIGK
jgi:hypothetical protein